jgi:hypothetical protein
MQFAFYNDNGFISGLHDVQEEINEISICPATQKPYGESVNDYEIMDIYEILNDFRILQYLAKDYPDDLVKAIRLMEI